MMKTTLISLNKYLLIFIFSSMIYGCSFTPDEPKVYTVEIENMQFVPQDITVRKGDTVLWINKDMVAHDVTEETTKAWSSSVIPPGGSWKMAVNDEADYYCSIHVVMKGKLKVE